MLSVIGAGFGRTGTMSLKVALDQLGFGPCYHMTEVFQHPDHLPAWEAATRGEAVDWEALLADYRATVDWPAAAFYDRLLERYPMAKVLLSVRDSQRWYDSVANTIRQAGRLARETGASPADPRFANRVQAGRMIEALIWQGTFGGAFEDRERAIAVYEAHNRAVQERVPADQLLVFEVREGWDPLCRFLDVRVPATPFPHLNDTASFQEMVRGAAGR